MTIYHKLPAWEGKKKVRVKDQDDDPGFVTLFKNRMMMCADCGCGPDAPMIVDDV